MTTAMAIFGILTILSSLGVLFSRKTLYSALWLVVTFFLVGVHYALLGAHFLANLQILVYAGAIMVLVVFVILLLGLNESGEGRGVGFPSFIFTVLAGVFLGVLFVGVLPIRKDLGYLAPPPVQPLVAAEKIGSPQELGAALFGKFLFPFEMVSVLLLAGIIGAVVLAYEPRRPLLRGRGLSAKQREYGHHDSGAENAAEGATT